MNPATLINQTSLETEWYTPTTIVDAARAAMGGIHLDPASSLAANERLHIPAIFTASDDGLKQEWFGNVWLNHPFGRAETACTSDCQRKIKNQNHICHSIDFHGNEAWIEKLIQESAKGMEQACCITYACTSEAWFRPLLDYPQCFLWPRTNYYLPNGEIKRGVTKGSVVTYIGHRTDWFYDSFRGLGTVKLSYHRGHNAPKTLSAASTAEKRLRPWGIHPTVTSRARIALARSRIGSGAF